MTNLRTATGNGLVLVLMLVALSGFEVGSAPKTGENVDHPVEPAGDSLAKVGDSSRNAEREGRD